MNVSSKYLAALIKQLPPFEKSVGYELRYFIPDPNRIKLSVKEIRSVPPRRIYDPPYLRFVKNFETLEWDLIL